MKVLLKNKKLTVCSADEADWQLALQPVTPLINPGQAYAECSRNWQGIPGIERTAGGRLWATWYTGGRTEDEFNHVVVVTSADGGRSWSEPVLAIDPPADVRASDPVLWHDPQGRLWLFWMQTAHCGITFDGRAGVWAICAAAPEYANCQWSAPRRIANGIMMNKPTVLSTGEWLLPCAIWSHKLPYRHDIPEERFSNVIISRDDGQSFELLGQADVPKRACDEHMIVERRDGSLWMLVRREDGIGEASSRDRGRTWMASPDVVLPGPCSRFHIRRLRSGRLLLINHHEFTQRNNLTAFLSDDDGLTWPHRLLLDERDSVSYPDAVEDGDGRIYVIYDRSRVGEGEVLMQTFTEDDVIKGSGGGFRHRQPMVISRIRRRSVAAEWVPLADEDVIDQSYDIIIGGEDDSRGDGLKWIQPAADEGEISIAPIWIAGDRLVVAAEVEDGGSIRVQLEDWPGTPFEGFSYADCLPLQGGGDEFVVAWRGGSDVGAFSADLIRMRFKMTRARISGIRFLQADEAAVLEEQMACRS